MRGFSLILRFGQAESQVVESSFVGVRRALQVRGQLEEVHNVREGRGMLEKWQVGECVCMADGGGVGSRLGVLGEHCCEGQWGRQ